MRIDDTGEIYLRYNHKKKNNNTVIAVSIIIAALILAAAAVLLYFMKFSTGAHLKNAYAKINSNDFQGAISELDEVIAQDSKNIEAYAGKAAAQIKMGDNAGADSTISEMWNNCDSDSYSGGGNFGGNIDLGGSDGDGGGGNDASAVIGGNDGGDAKNDRHTYEPQNTNEDYIAEILRFLFVWQCKYNIASDRAEHNELNMEAIDLSGLNALFKIYTRPNQPTADPQSGKYDKPLVVKLSAGNKGTICYRIRNESFRLKESTIYSEPIYIKKNNSVTHITAAVYDDLFIPSDMVHMQYELSRAPLMPAEYSVKPGSYSSAVDLVLNNPNSDGKIYYTTGGDEPTTSSNEYQGKIHIGEGSTTVKVKIIDAENDIASETISLEYKVTIPKPTPTPKVASNDGCPKCGSKNITLVGNRNNPGNQAARCLECGYKWDSGTKTEGADNEEGGSMKCPYCGTPLPTAKTYSSDGSWWYRCPGCSERIYTEHSFDNVHGIGNL